MKIFKILCAALILGNQQKQDGNVSSMCNGIIDFWKENSNNTYKFQKKVISYKSGSEKLNVGESEIIKKFPDYDLYAIVNSKNTVSHAGWVNKLTRERVAHLKNTLIRTGAHEVGHLLGLGHSNRLINNKVEFYEDHFSAMGKYPSNTLAGPQYLFLNVINNRENLIFPNQKSNQLCRILDWKCNGTFVLRNGDGYNSLYIKNGKLIIISYTCVNNCRGTINTDQTIINNGDTKIIGNYKFINKKGIITYKLIN